MTYDISLEGKVALVTGSSRGIGKGIALELAALGATVYVTGRTIDAEASPIGGNETRIGGTVGQTAREVDDLGGTGIAVRCDHGDDADVQQLFDQLARDHGGLDILVNNAFAGPELAARIGKCAWEQTMEAWDEVHRVGLRSAYAAAILAAPYMIEKRSGLIANISSYGAVDYLHGVPYGTAKAALDRLTRGLGHELAEYDVTVVSLWPGTVRTELVLSLFEDDGHGGKHLVFPADPGSEQEEPTDIANTESPRFSGRAVAAVYNDEKRMQRTGGAYPVAAIAEDYGYTDLDGSRPPVFYSHEDARRVLPKQPNR